MSASNCVHSLEKIYENLIMHTTSYVISVHFTGSACQLCGMHIMKCAYAVDFVQGIGRVFIMYTCLDVHVRIYECMTDSN